MAARVIDASRFDDRQYFDFVRDMKKPDNGRRWQPRFSRERIDEELFGPLAERIIRGGTKMEDAEKTFRSSVYHFERARGSGLEVHFANYIGFLFETAIQLAILDFARDNPGVLSVLTNLSGELRSGYSYTINSRGSATFINPRGASAAEIDAIGEYRDGPGIVPVMFEITLMKWKRRYNSRKKMKLVEGMRGCEPSFCIIRQAGREEMPGAYLRTHPGRGTWRDVLVPRNDALPPLADKLMREEHEARASGKPEKELVLGGAH